MIQLWMTRPGRLKVRFHIPNWLAKLMFAPLEPLQRILGLPAAVRGLARNGFNQYVHELLQREGPA